MNEAQRLRVDLRSAILCGIGIGNHHIWMAVGVHQASLGTGKDFLTFSLACDGLLR